MTSRVDACGVTMALPDHASKGSAVGNTATTDAHSEHCMPLAWDDSVSPASESVLTSFTAPDAEQTICMDDGLMKLVAIDVPMNNKNHASTRRLVAVWVRRNCMP